ncbi:alpha/beta fold hydrolase [Metabacillus litoralis]|uniref:alpha/beta fold hydrolase n=1 Tax=Metabacillus litoralis TaxID=152268 RepID=UPI001CFD62DE|nr:alpha/beta hydrolase [Metabacillus litoralis]
MPSDSVILENGNQITYEDLGKGTPVIFVHPPGMGRHVFYYQQKLKKNMRLIIPDLSGHGDSSKIHSNNVSIHYYAEEIIALMDKLMIDKAVLCGYSAGGAITQYLSIHFKERVIGLILFGGYPAVLNTFLQWEHKAGSYMVKHHRKFLAQILALSHTKNKKLQKLLFNHMLKSQKNVWYQYYQEVLHINLINDLHKISIPVLLMYGTKSDLINKYNAYFKKQIKKYRIVYFKHTNHQVPTKRWKLANEEIIKYINGTIENKGI